MAGTVPEQNPIGDSFTGMILQIDEAQVLSTVDSSVGQVIATGTFIIRYGLRFLGKLHISIVPGLVVLD
ncbi:MAG: hypothetical protein H0X30_37300, partial [Anaerolineae bacterium]|nr:hypothetical protein [Anaerolineae bacterium]